jgi:hypothetical protein
MKNFCIIVATRLALFPLVFNLSFAQEVEVNPEEMEQISPTIQISPTPLYQEGQESSEIGEEYASLIKEGDHEVVEDLDSLLRSE